MAAGGKRGDRKRGLVGHIVLTSRKQREMNELSSLSLSQSVQNSSPGNSTTYIQGVSPHLSLHSMKDPLTSVPRGLWSVELIMLTISLPSFPKGRSEFLESTWFALDTLSVCERESQLRVHPHPSKLGTELFPPSATPSVEDCSLWRGK